MKKEITALIIFLIGLFILNGLGETAQKSLTPPPPTLPVVQKASPPLASSVTPSVTPATAETAWQAPPPYNPIGKPDPFLPTTLTNEQVGFGKKKLLPLEQFDVGDFDLVGVVTWAGIKKAIVQDVTGKGFFIQVGTRIGKQGGKVTKILDNEIQISEPFTDFMGRKGSKLITLKPATPRSENESLTQSTKKGQ